MPRMEIILTLLFGATFLYVLYYVIRTAVRDGIKDAREGGDS